MRALVIVPACDEATSIVPTLWRIRRETPDATVLVVDTGSSDGTADLALAVGRTVGDVFVLRRPQANAAEAYSVGAHWARDNGYDVVPYRDRLDRVA